MVVVESKFFSVQIIDILEQIITGFYTTKVGGFYLDYQSFMAFTLHLSVQKYGNISVHMM